MDNLKGGQSGEATGPLVRTLLVVGTQTLSTTTLGNSLAASYKHTPILWPSKRYSQDYENLQPQKY